jgi:peptidoglycan/xylan/chitin deacetylase (PgdA/CDA1 family)
MSFMNRTLGPLLFPSILWHTSERSAHLTFDDGPDPRATPVVLDVLRRRNVAATFFVMGSTVKQFPELARRIHEEGHAIANHAHTHDSLFLKPKAAQAGEIEKAATAIAEVTGRRPVHLRPPYGRFDLNTIIAARETHHRIAMWDIDPRDFSARADGVIIDKIIANAGPGSIILLHDNDATAHRISSLLDRLLDQLLERGLAFSPLPV